MIFNMRMRYGGAVITFVVLLSGCVTSPPDKPAPKKPIAAAALCDGMFGKETGGDLQRLLNGRKHFYPRTGTEANTVERVAEQMRKQVGNGRHPGTHFEASSACSFLLCDQDVRDVCGGTREIDFLFGWTRERDFPVNENDRVWPFAAGDALLTFEVGSANEDPVTARFECRLDDGGGIVQGHFEGSWWKNELNIDEKREARFRLLLASSERMSSALGCTNKPQLAPSSRLRDLAEK